MPGWHSVYFELKFLLKSPMQEKHFDPLLCLPESKKWKSPVKGTLPASEGRRTTHLQRQKIQIRSLYTKNLDIFKIYYLKPKIFLGALLFKHLSLKFICPVNSSQVLLFLCLKSIKAACFGHFLGPISLRLPAQIKMFLFLLFICLRSV